MASVLAFAMLQFCGFRQDENRLEASFVLLLFYVYSASFLNYYGISLFYISSLPEKTVSLLLFLSLSLSTAKYIILLRLSFSEKVLVGK